MHKKALTIAIAGALAVPMAAQAVDFTIAGHVNRALVITNTDASTSATVRDNGESSTRIRASGSSDLANGSTVSILFEYEVGGSHDVKDSGRTSPVPAPGYGISDDNAGGTGVKLRHANVQYGGNFGRVTIGQGSEGGDGSQYAGVSGVWGARAWVDNLYGRLLRLPRRGRPDRNDPLRHPGYRPGLGRGVSGERRPPLGASVAEHRRCGLLVPRETRHSRDRQCQEVRRGARFLVHRCVVRRRPCERPQHLRCLGEGQRDAGSADRRKTRNAVGAGRPGRASR